jgi:hypothetical protein
MFVLVLKTPLKKNIRLVLAVSTLLLAGCSSPVRTLEFKEGKLSMTEEGRDGVAPTKWELKEASSAAEMKTLRQSGWKLADGTVRNSVLHHEGGPDTFLMKRKVNPLTAAPTAAAPAPFRPMLITTLGTNTSSDGTWRIGVSERSLELSRSAAAQGEGWRSSGWTTTGFGTASPWTAHAGWFAFIESPSRVWAYDGDHLLILETYTSSGRNSSSTIYESRFPCAVPAEVFSRLPERKQKEIQTYE